jgi:hypothetical protein
MNVSHLGQSNPAIDDNYFPNTASSDYKVQPVSVDINSSTQGYYAGVYPRSIHFGVAKINHSMFHFPARVRLVSSGQ